MTFYRIGKLKGRYVVTWRDDPDDKNTRRRFRLKARNKREAEEDAERKYRSYLYGRKSSLTFSTLWNNYSESVKNRPTARTLASFWKTIGPALGHYDPKMINDSAIAQYLRSRRAKKSPITKRNLSNTTLSNEVQMIQTVLNYAFHKNIIDFKPIKFRKPIKTIRRERWLTDEEIQALLTEASGTPHLFVAVSLLLATAGRLGAVLELTWTDVSFEKNTIDLRVDDGEDLKEEDFDANPYGVLPSHHKKRRAFVPMSSGMRKLLWTWKDTCDSEYVVEYRGGQIRSITTAFQNCVRRAGLVDVNIHSLRHTAAVHMAKAGCSFERISQYLGHSSVAVTREKYARFAPDHLRMEADSVDFNTKFNASMDRSTNVT